VSDDLYPSEGITPEPIPPADPFSGADESEGFSPGRIVFGLIVLAVGVFWLLQSLDVDLDIPWTAVLSGALIVTGFALVFLAPSGNRSGLVGLGITLTVLLGLITTVQAIGDISFAGGIGEKNERPVTIDALEEPFRLGIGDLEVDLRGVSFPDGTTEVAASVGIGHLVVRVPHGVTIEAEASVGAGEIVILNEKRDGVGVDWAYVGADGQPKRVLLDVSVGLGQIEVDQ
jgi:hypothetical protein